MSVRSSKLLFCAGVWAALESNQDQWIQADLLTTHRIESVTTQGRPDNNYRQWVTSYYVSYSQDGTNWTDIPGLYTGNFDQNRKKTNRLPEGTEARYIRLRPNTWSGHISMRFDVTGCALHGKDGNEHNVHTKMLSSGVHRRTTPPPVHLQIFNQSIEHRTPQSKYRKA